MRLRHIWRALAASIGLLLVLQVSLYRYVANGTPSRSLRLCASTQVHTLMRARREHLRMIVSFVCVPVCPLCALLMQMDTKRRRREQSSPRTG